MPNDSAQFHAVQTLIASPLATAGMSVVIASSSSKSVKARAADRALIVGLTRRIRPWLRLFRFPSQRLQRFRWRYRFLKQSASRTCHLQSVARALRPRADHQCNHGHVGDGIYEQTLASNSRGGAERAEHVPVNVFFGVSDAKPRRKPGQAVAGSNNKVFTAVLDDEPASLANGNHRALGFYRSDPHLWVKLLRCFSPFRPEPFTDVVAVLCLCWLVALLFLPLARVGENRFVKIGEYLRLFGFHHLRMIVMNMTQTSRTM
jgi:hypothetical protein